MTTNENSKVPFVVCPECEGRGQFGPGFVWTQDDIDQSDPEEFADMQRMLREGQFDVKCEFCKGERVVTPEHADDWRDWREYQDEVAAEQRYFGYMR